MEIGLIMFFVSEVNALLRCSPSVCPHSDLCGSPTSPAGEVAVGTHRRGATQQRQENSNISIAVMQNRSNANALTRCSFPVIHYNCRSDANV